MNDFLSRRVAAAEQAKAQQAKDKQALWLEIQDKAPGMAKDLKALSAVFGKVKLISVEFNEKGLWMCKLEKLSLLCAGTSAYHPPISSDNFSFGGERLTPAEVAGMLSGLNAIELALVYAKYLGDLASERKLWANVYEWAAGVAVRESWPIQRGQPVVANMAYIAVFEIVRPNRCGKCKGTGLVKAKACTQCAGSGFKPLSGRSIAEAIGYGETTYRDLWKSRYSMVFGYVQDIESRAVSRIRIADREVA